uniref:RRP15-like protein n=1 Tax=Syphacia muris TaxID=451379 RepID=A0A158R401_9BILA
MDTIEIKEGSSSSSSDEDEKPVIFEENEGEGENNSDGVVEFDTEVPKPKKKKLTRKELRKRRKAKKDNDRLALKLPNIVTDREKEWALLKIATLGVVQLFNAVSERQKDVEDKLVENRRKMNRHEKREMLKNFDSVDFYNRLDRVGKVKDELPDVKPEIVDDEKPSALDVSEIKTEPESDGEYCDLMDSTRLVLLFISISSVYSSNVKRDTGYIHIQLSSANLFPPSTSVPFLQFSDGVNATGTWNPQYEHASTTNQNYETTIMPLYQSYDSVGFNSGRQNPYFNSESQLQQQRLPTSQTTTSAYITSENNAQHIQNYSSVQGNNPVNISNSINNQQTRLNNTNSNAAAPEVLATQQRSGNNNVNSVKQAYDPFNSNPTSNLQSNQTILETSSDFNTTDPHANNAAFYCSPYEVFQVLTICFAAMYTLYCYS